MRINLNDRVRFIPTREGALLWNKSGEGIWASPGQTVETHLWVLFSVFGPKMSMGGESPIEGHAVVLVEDDHSPAEGIDTSDSVPAELADKIHQRMLDRYEKVLDSGSARSAESVLQVVAEELAGIRILTGAS